MGMKAKNKEKKEGELNQGNLKKEKQRRVLLDAVNLSRLANNNICDIIKETALLEIEDEPEMYFELYIWQRMLSEKLRDMESNGWETDGRIKQHADITQRLKELNILLACDELTHYCDEDNIESGDVEEKLTASMLPTNSPKKKVGQHEITKGATCDEEEKLTVAMLFPSPPERVTSQYEVISKVACQYIEKFQTLPTRHELWVYLISSQSGLTIDGGQIVGEFKRPMCGENFKGCFNRWAK